MRGSRGQDNPAATGTTYEIRANPKSFLGVRGVAGFSVFVHSSILGDCRSGAV